MFCVALSFQFIFLRPRIESVQKNHPELYYLVATYHSIFHYDETHRRSTRTPARRSEVNMSHDQNPSGFSSSDISSGNDIDDRDASIPAAMAVATEGSLLEKAKKESISTDIPEDASADFSESLAMAPESAPATPGTLTAAYRVTFSTPPSEKSVE